MSISEMIVWLFGLLCAAIVLCSPAACTANRHIQIERAIASGADPLAAKCAIEGENGESKLCLAFIVRTGAGGEKK